MVTGILNRHLPSEIQYHDTLHGFCAGKGMGTAYPEAKLIQQTTTIKDEVLYEIYIDLHKAYNALDGG